MAKICIWITASPKPKECPLRRPVSEKLNAWLGIVFRRLTLSPRSNVMITYAKSSSCPQARQSSIPRTDPFIADYLSGYSRLCEVPFPEILKLLFDLVDVRLVDIPPFSLISLEPEATVTCPTPNQETIHFTLTGKVDACPGPGPARTILPALTLFRVRGISVTWKTSCPGSKHTYSANCR
jgi:hypothetical protein